MVSRPFSVASDHVMRPGSEVPGPPRGGPPPGRETEGFTDATSNLRFSVPCPKAKAPATTVTQAINSACRIPPSVFRRDFLCLINHHHVELRFPRHQPQPELLLDRSGEVRARFARDIG